jgi:hypothetical protein
VEHAGEAEIVDILRAAAHFPQPFLANRSFADNSLLQMRSIQAKFAGQEKFPYVTTDA